MDSISHSSNVIAHYSERSEVGRLSNQKSKRTEFLTTVHVLDRYLQPESHILDIGAGPGCYTFHYAAQGHRLVARDIVPHHVDLIISDPLYREHNIDAAVGDARDLSEFAEDTFDAVLCLGPFYHIGPQEERRLCVSECLRVLKPGGILAVAYINKFYVFVHVVKQKREYLSDALREQIMDNEVVVRDDPDNVWFFDSPSEVETFMTDFNVARLANAATDGVATLVPELVDSFDDAEYEQWLKYHFSTCEEPSILGYSNHALYVCRKRQ